MEESQGKRIKKSRIEKGLTQEQIAKLMNLTRNAVGSWENGRALPPAKHFPKLASILGVSVAYLQMETDYPYINKTTLIDDEKKLLDGYRQLNAEGKKALNVYISFLVGQEVYTKKITSIS